MPQAKLWCIDITGSPSVVNRRIFSVAFIPAQNLESLRDAIRKELKHKAKEIVEDLGKKEESPVVLDLWRLDPSLARGDARFNQETTTTYSDLKGSATLLKTDFAGNLGDIYLDLPDEECLHLLVSLSGSEVAKGPIDFLISELLDIKQGEARQRSADWRDSLGDSTFESRPDVIAKRQRGEDPFQEIPLAILHPVFDSFLYDLHNDDLDIPHLLYPLTREFSSSFPKFKSSFNSNEAKTTFISSLEDLLDCKCITRTTEGAAFDGISLIDDVYPSLIFHRQLVVAGDIMSQVQKVYRKCVRLAVYDSIRRRVALPCFVLVIAGSYISVFGAGNPSFPVVERLMGFELCTKMPSDPGTSIERLARLFTCLRRALKSLKEYYTALPIVIPRLSKRYHPFRNRFLTANGEKVVFEYHSLAILGKLIWLAELPDGTIVVVKFTRSYGAPAHQLLASAGLAPRLYYADNNEGTNGNHYWCMIVMEYIPDAVRLDQFQGTRSDSLRIAEDLQRAVELLHTDGFVFGDLRSTNILVRVSKNQNKVLKFYLVDFDWSGKVGEARYPVGISFTGKIKWPDGVWPRGFITKDHDLHWLRNLSSLYIK
ncbi:Pkinasedomain-containingprotein [Moniliophthora roreri MCA 2997]|uniref:Pkinasedomain-containingprotein n=1 Tax=Moniliophthora roreri (strain MCA 2997) TaxID=1381753 RepID=V2X0B2_MONRO|nr:Pkinasedomain-containingprotein [Moniliophthora roreri MCA 2997]